MPSSFVPETTLSTRAGVHKRSEGANAVAASAYRGGLALTDGHGTTHDYTRRHGIEHHAMLAPEGSPDWAYDAGEFWHRAEAVERRKDAQVAREWRFSFPYGYTPEMRREEADRVAQHFVNRGMIAQVDVHRYGGGWYAGGEETAKRLADWQRWGLPFLEQEESLTDERQHVMVTRNSDGSIKDYRLFQPHCHILLGMRPIKADGSGFEAKSQGSRARAWNQQALFDGLRERIAARQSRQLEELGSVWKVDHRSYAERHKEALEKQEAAAERGDVEEATRQQARAEHFARDPQPVIGLTLRLKQLSDRMRERSNAWAGLQRLGRLRDMVQRVRDFGGLEEAASYAQAQIEEAARHLALTAGKPAFAAPAPTSWTGRELHRRRAAENPPQTGPDERSRGPTGFKTMTSDQSVKRHAEKRTWRFWRGRGRSATEEPQERTPNRDEGEGYER